MVEIGNPYNRESLLDAVEKVNWIVTKTIHDLTLDDFYMRYGKHWSASDTIQHLIKSIQPVVACMRYPKIYLGMKYGRIDRPSRRYDQIVAMYREALTKGVGPDKYAPILYEVPYSEDEAERYQKQDQKKWRRTSDGFHRAVAKWYDFQMDKYQLPHPVLGLISVREMIMFNIFHNLHHTESTLRRIQENAVYES